MSAPIRWGIIGCGAVTEVKSGPPYQQTAGFSLEGVFRRDLAKAQDYAHRHHVNQVFDSAESLIQSADIDAVYIATPPDSHKYYALKVARAGKPCCIEKPLSPSYADSRAIVAAFEQRKIPLFVAYYRRSLPRFNFVKTSLNDNVIGNVRHVSWHLSKAPNEWDVQGKPNWRTDAAIAPAGYFDDLASHGLDLLSWLLGDFTHVHGFATNQQDLYSAKDAITACWLHDGGVTGTGSWNFGTRERSDEVVLYGSEGEIRFSVFEEEDVVITNSDGAKRHFIPNPHHVQQHHVENLANALISGVAHPSTGLTALHTSWVMDKILVPFEQ